MFAAQCPKCGHSWRVAGSAKAGERITCKSCTNPFVLSPVPLATTTVPREPIPGMQNSAESSGPREDTLGASPALPANCRVTLEILEGDRKGAVVEVTKPRISFGRGVGDVSLADSQVSRKHAVLEIYGDRYALLRDLASTNGTYANGMLVSQTRVWNGDVMRFGDTQMRLNVEKKA